MGERIEVVYEPERRSPISGEALKQARGEEIRRGASLVGPQRDAVEILLDGRPLASYGSGGQVRTALWLLKLTRVQLLSERDAPAAPLPLGRRGGRAGRGANRPDDAAHAGQGAARHDRDAAPGFRMGSRSPASGWKPGTL